MKCSWMNFHGKSHRAETCGLMFDSGLRSSELRAAAVNPTRRELSASRRGEISHSLNRHESG